MYKQFETNLFEKFAYKARVTRREIYRERGILFYEYL